MEQEPNPEQPGQQQPAVPQQTAVPAPEAVEKTHWVLYVVVVVVSFIVLLSLSWILTLLTSFTPSLTMFYVAVSIISLVLGLISGFILNKIAKSNKSFLFGGAIPAILAGALISIYLSAQKRTAEQMAEMAEGGIGGLVGLFGEMPNAFLTGILMIIFFNLAFLVLFFRKSKPTKTI